MEISGYNPIQHITKTENTTVNNEAEVKASQMQALAGNEEKKSQFDELYEVTGAQIAAETSIFSKDSVQEIKGQFEKQSAESTQTRPVEVSEVRAKEQVEVQQRAQQAYQAASNQFEPTIYGQGYDAKL